MRHFGTTSFLALCGLLLTAGCSQQLSGAAEPGVNIAQYHSFYVAREKENDVTNAIQKDLAGRGLTAAQGLESTVPPAADCKVLAQDKWMWDITMYPLEIKVDFVNPKTGALLASGRSYRTSMVRKSPEEMVKEIFDKIFASAATPPK